MDKESNFWLYSVIWQRGMGWPKINLRVINPANIFWLGKERLAFIFKKNYSHKPPNIDPRLTYAYLVLSYNHFSKKSKIGRKIWYLLIDAIGTPQLAFNLCSVSMSFHLLSLTADHTSLLWTSAGLYFRGTNEGKDRTRNTRIVPAEKI